MKKTKTLLIINILLVLVSCFFNISNFLINLLYNDKTVENVIELMKEPWQELVIIEDEKILYIGNVENIDNDLLEKEIYSISNCEDEFAITLILK